MTDKSNSKIVSFSGEVPEKVKSKQPPTQKYDRKEIQKRLDIENWMDDELKRLYGDEVSTVVWDFLSGVCGEFGHTWPIRTTVEPVLNTTSIQRPPALSNHFLKLSNT